MTERESRTNRARRLAREQALYRYSNALERGDFATVAALLRQAEHDPALAQMIQEVNAALQAESEVLRPPAPLWRSTNGHARAAQQPRSNQVETQEQSEMAVNTTQIPRSAGMRRSWRVMPLTALAATLAVILFAGLLILSGGGRAIVPGAAPGNGDSGDGSGGGLLQEASATVTPTFTSTPVSSATFTLTPTITPTSTRRPDLVITATPVGGSQGEFNASPTIVPPDAFTTIMPITATPVIVPPGGVVPTMPFTETPFLVPPGGEATVMPPTATPVSADWAGGNVPMVTGLVQTIGTGTINGFLPDGDQVAAYLYVARQDETVLVTFSAVSSAPWLHVEALDDDVVDSGIDPAQAPANDPLVYSLTTGDRLLLLVGTVNRDETSSFILTLQAAQETSLTPRELSLDVDSSAGTMTFAASMRGSYILMPTVVLEEGSSDAQDWGRIHVTISQGGQTLAGADFNFPMETGVEQQLHPLGITPGGTGNVTISVQAEAPAGATFSLRFSGVVFGEGG